MLSDKFINVHKHISNPTHKITVALIGVGGTGSHMLNNLCRMNKALMMLNHPGLYVEAYDYKNVQPHNMGRQLFFPSDIGKNKATVLVSRANRSYGLNWIGYDHAFTLNELSHNILITCVDVVNLRIDLSIFGKRSEPYHGLNRSSLYWLDIGNNKLNGQIYLNDYGNSMYTYEEMFPNVFPKELSEEPEGEGCSILNAFNAQELYINQFLADIAAHMFYMILKTHKISYNLVYANLETLNIQKQLCKKEKAM